MREKLFLAVILLGVAGLRMLTKCDYFEKPRKYRCRQNYGVFVRVDALGAKRCPACAQSLSLWLPLAVEVALAASAHSYLHAQRV